jgi:hypothetical protein
LLNIRQQFRSSNGSPIGGPPTGEPCFLLQFKLIKSCGFKIDRHKILANSQLNQEGTTVLMVTHSERDAGYAQRIINLLDGQVVPELKL